MPSSSTFLRSGRLSREEAEDWNVGLRGSRTRGSLRYETRKQRDLESALKSYTSLRPTTQEEHWSWLSSVTVESLTMEVISTKHKTRHSHLPTPYQYARWSCTRRGNTVYSSSCSSRSSSSGSCRTQWGCADRRCRISGVFLRTCRSRTFSRSRRLWRNGRSILGRHLWKKERFRREPQWSCAAFALRLRGGSQGRIRGFGDAVRLRRGYMPWPQGWSFNQVRRFKDTLR